jgi:hypothetical protein
MAGIPAGAGTEFQLGAAATSVRVFGNARTAVKLHRYQG